MNRIIIFSVFLVAVFSACEKEAKVDPYRFTAPYEVQRHFAHPVRWNASRQERWVNKELWVDSIGRTKFIIIRHSGVKSPLGALSIQVK